MGFLEVIDQTDENAGGAVTEEMFGLNSLFTVTIPDLTQIGERYQDLGATGLRYPGGSITEWYFDISDISGGSHERTVGSFQGTTQTLTPFTDFVALAAGLDTGITLVVPTISGFTQSAGEALIAGTYGQRVVDAGHLENVSAFIRAAVETARMHGVTIDALEIGNEFWGSGQMTALEYGRLAAAMSQVIADTFSDMGIAAPEQPDIVVQTTSSAGLFSPSSDTSLYVDEETKFVYTARDLQGLDAGVIANLTEVTVASQGTSRPQVLEIIAAFDRETITMADDQGQLTSLDTSDAADAIDGVVEHYYLDGGFAAVNTAEQFGFSQLDLWNIALETRDSALPDLDFYITEWNTRKNGDVELANNRGLQQVSMTIETFYEMATHNVTSANFWPAIFNHSNSGTLMFNSADALTLVGEGFALMSESLVGLTPNLDFRVAGEVAIHGYGDSDQQVYFLSERSGSENRMELDLSAAITLDAAYYRVSWTELWDGGAGGTDEMAQPVISTTRIIDPMAAGALDAFLLTMQAWSVMRLDIEAVDAADAASTLPGVNVPNARLVEGSEADDRMRGGLGNDIILGLAGNDNMNGYEGDDRVSGGAGDDFVKGGWGNDKLIGGAGNDTLTGDWGNDKVWAGSGDDIVYGGDGHDIIRLGIGNDSVDGGTGDDVIWGAADADTLSGDAGNDKLWGGAGNDDIRGGDGNDTSGGGNGHDLLDAGAGDDAVSGGVGNDTIGGGDGSDTLSGGDGDDLLHGGAGRDVLRGGAGADIFVASSDPDSTDIVQDFMANEDRLDVSFWAATSLADLKFDVTTNRIIIRATDGSRAAVVLSAPDGALELSERDFIFAPADTDTAELPSEPGPDQPPVAPDDILIHSGTEGDDLFRIDSLLDTVVMAGAGVDTVESSVNFTLRRHSGGDDIEILVLTGNEDLVGVGNAADNLLVGNAGANHLSGVWGDDTVHAGAGDDTIKGVNGDDWLFGMDGRDEISGDLGNDALFGGAGDDLLAGGDGNDLLVGGEGNDVLIGGDGADRFVFLTGNNGQDVISDFEVASDILDFSLTDDASLQDLVITLEDDRIVVQGSGGVDVALVGLNGGDLAILTERGTVFAGQDGIATSFDTASAFAYEHPLAQDLMGVEAWLDTADHGAENALLLGW